MRMASLALGSIHAKGYLTSRCSSSRAFSPSVRLHYSCCLFLCEYLVYIIRIENTTKFPLVSQIGDDLCLRHHALKLTTAVGYIGTFVSSNCHISVMDSFQGPTNNRVCAGSRAVSNRNCWTRSTVKSGEQPIYTTFVCDLYLPPCIYAFRYGPNKNTLVATWKHDIVGIIYMQCACQGNSTVARSV